MLCSQGLALLVRSLLSPLVAIGLSTLAVAQSPNLLVIVADDLGTDSVGCYGSAGAAPTPNIDALAQGGMRFTNCRVNPACSPTRAAIFTGRYAFRGECTGALGPGATGLAANAMTLAAPLNDAGYETAMIGKWHMGNRYGPNTPAVYGWTHFEGVLDSGVPNYFNWQKTTNGVTTTCTTYQLTDQVDSAIQWIQGRTGPWALALTLALPHQPFHTPPSTLHTQNLAGLNPATTPRPFFLAMVQAMDNELGRLFATLGSSVLNNTNIVFVSDNGTDGAVVPPPLTADRAKGSLYEGGARVPLIFRGPAVANGGTTANELVSAVDLFPTLLSICNVAFPSAALAPSALPLDGLTFHGALSGQTGYGRSYVYTELTNAPLGDGYAIRTQTHKLIRYMLNQPQHQEFYDLVADPDEQNNLLAAPLAPAQLSAFQQISAALETIRNDGWGELYGTGCPGSGGVPFLRWQTQPRLGTVFWTHMSNIGPGSATMMALVGLSRTSTGGAPLPLPLTLAGMPGCELAVSLDGIAPVFPTGYGVALPIPPIPLLYQVEFYVQGMSFEPTINPTGVVFSRGLRLVIGQ